MKSAGMLVLAFLLGWVPSLRAESSSPRTVVSLNGEWQCETGGRDAPPGAWTRRVPVPGLVDLCRPALKWEDHEYFWYRTSFVVPPGKATRRARIRIEQSQYGSEVWLNGRKLGSYDGCYTSHEYDAGDALDRSGPNELIVRVGRKDTLPADNAAGRDGEKLSFIPGIWGDVSLVLTGDPRIGAVRVTPRVKDRTAEIAIRVETATGERRKVVVSAAVAGKKTGAASSETVFAETTVEPGDARDVVLRVPIETMRLWSPEDPFLYVLTVGLRSGGEETDRTRTTFGMREFEVRGSDFFLNGKRVFLKGGNFAFHRFLSDPGRGRLPWDADWVRRAVGEIPRRHGFNYFRFHLGHAYNLWYDMADEYGLLIQDEWQAFGRLDASRDVIRAEFARWIEDNYNHPSIVIWDPLNEPSTKEASQAYVRLIRDDIVPEMRRLDPTRPWDFVDFEEEHPYIYSLGPVLNDRPFGFARSIRDMQESPTPTVINEFPWFWLRHDGRHTDMTGDTVARWLGKGPIAAQEQLAYQAFLTTELTEQFRRMRADAIAPFTYVGANAGPTADWFLGDPADLRPKPVVAALSNAFAPFGVSVELWDRHFVTNESRRVNVYVFNDRPDAKQGELTCRILRGRECAFERRLPVTVGGGGTSILPVEWVFPSQPGRYVVEAALTPAGAEKPEAFSRKIAHVFGQVDVPAELRGKRIVVYDPDEEILRFLRSVGLNAVPMGAAGPTAGDIMVVGEGGLVADGYTSRLGEIGRWVAAGGALVAIEPDFGAPENGTVRIAGEIECEMRQRYATDHGGYDSAVFPAAAGDPLWKGLRPEHLVFLNGGFGGVMVSDRDLLPAGMYVPRAYCGLGLGTPAILELAAGEGVVVLSRIQVRGRLMPQGSGEGLYDLRADPVAQRLLLNLLATYAGYRPRPILPPPGRAIASSGNEGELAARFAVDGDPATRWSSAASDPQWIVWNLGEKTDVSGVTLNWETAYGKEYRILLSEDGRTWKPVFYERNGDGGVDEPTFAPAPARYVAVLGLRRATGWGYSLWEMGVVSPTR